MIVIAALGYRNICCDRKGFESGFISVLFLIHIVCLVKNYFALYSKVLCKPTTQYKLAIINYLMLAYEIVPFSDVCTLLPNVVRSSTSHFPSKRKKDLVFLCKLPTLLQIV